MDNFFNKIKVGILNDHFKQLGGGTVHSFKFIEYLKKYYDCDIYLPNKPKSKKWMKKMLHLDTENLNFYKYSKDIGKKYKHLFINISHWKAVPTNALYKYMVVFFPQFNIPTYNYKFLANSNYTKKNIVKKWSKEPDKIKVIYPPVMTKQFEPNEKENIILHVSRLARPRPEADKGHRQMIQSFKNMCNQKLDNWEFHLIGEVQDPKYVSNLKSIASNYPIFFHKGIPFNELKNFYGKSKIYWHLTGISMPEYEGAQEHFGMTIVEAMASGCVPISLKTGGCKEIIDDKKDGYLIKNTEELKKKTFKLIRNTNKLVNMSKKAIKKSKSFDEKKTERNFYNAVTDVNKVSIVILTWNNVKYTKECVERLYKVTPPGFQLILIDNNSNSKNKDILKSIRDKYRKKGHDIQITFLRKNWGYAKGNNKGLVKANRKYIVYLNNDTLPQWGWLERMLNVFKIKEDVGIVGAKLYFPKKENDDWRIQHAGIKFSRSNEPKHIGRHKKDKDFKKKGIEEVEAVTGACLIVPRKYAKLNDNFIRGYYEDIDLCLRIREKGFKIYLNHEAKLIHYEGKTQDILKKKDKKKFTKISKKNKKLFHKIWDDKINDLPSISKTLDTSNLINTVKYVEVGGGENPLYPNYTQIDLRKLPNIDYYNDIRALPFASNSINKICACYILQCLPQREVISALKELHRILKPRGELEIHVPDLDKITRQFISTKNKDFIKEIYGKQNNELNYYQSGWIFKTLDNLLTKVNFVRTSKIKAPKIRPYALSIKTYKWGKQ